MFRSFTRRNKMEDDTHLLINIGKSNFNPFEIDLLKRHLKCVMFCSHPHQKLKYRPSPYRSHTGTTKLDLQGNDLTVYIIFVTYILPILVLLDYQTTIKLAQ